MTDPENGGPAPHPTEDAEARPLSRWVVALPAITFLVGLILGGFVIGVAGNGDGVGSSGDQAGETPSSSPGPATAVVVPDACLEAARTVQQAVALIRGGVGAIRSFEADKILELLNQLEDLDTLAREQADTCSASTVTDAPLPGEDTEPAPSEPTDPTVPTEPASS